MSTLSAITCSECGVAFGVPDAFARARREDHRTFWCPNGHGQVFLWKTEAEKLREELDAKKRSLAWTEERLAEARRERDRNESRRRAEKAAKTVLRKKLYPEEFTKEEEG